MILLLCVGSITGSSLSFLTWVVGGFFYFPDLWGSVQGEMRQGLVLGLSLNAGSAQALFSLFGRQWQSSGEAAPSHSEHGQPASVKEDDRPPPHGTPPPTRLPRVNV